MQGWRKRMEDSHIAETNIKKDTHIFGVFDGHGGKEVAQLVKKYFVKELKANKSFTENNMKKALQETFLRIDEICVMTQYMAELKELNKVSKKEDVEIEKSQPKNVYSDLFGSMQQNNENIALMTGCTATVCLIHENKVYFANAGDSRVVISKNGVAIPMTVDHKPDLEEEKNRIYKAGGTVTDGRVNGNLNLSRSLGDLEYKQNKKLKPEQQIVTAYPDITEESLSNIDMILLACDGVWDCKTNQEAIDFATSKIKKGSKDVKLSTILGNLMDECLATDIMNGNFLI
jgi:serine/threonine protein phosphatase PrpC